MLNIAKLAVTISVGALLAACGGSSSGEATNPEMPKKYRAADIDTYSVGTLKAMVNGKPHIWKADKRQSEWSGELDTLLTTASIYSLPSPDNHYPGNLSFSISRTDDNWRAMGIEIFFGKPDIFSFSTSNDGAADFEVTAVKMVGDSMNITGTFSASMPAVYQAGGDSDMSNSLAVKDGTFDIALPPRPE